MYLFTAFTAILKIKSESDEPKGENAMPGRPVHVVCGRGEGRIPKEQVCLGPGRGVGWSGCSDSEFPLLSFVCVGGRRREGGGA